MKESLANFRKAVNESADFQKKIKGGADLVELGKENGHDFSEEDVKAAYDELKDSEEELTEFELDLVGGSFGGRESVISSSSSDTVAESSGDVTIKSASSRPSRIRGSGRNIGLP